MFIGSVEAPSFLSIAQVRAEEFVRRAFTHVQLSRDGNNKVAFPIHVLNVFGSVSVFAIEVDPLTEKVVSVKVAEFMGDATKDEVAAFLSTLKKTDTYIYSIGSVPTRVLTDTQMGKVCAAIDDHFGESAGAVTKGIINVPPPWYSKRGHDFISASLDESGSLIYCLHNLMIASPN